MTTALEKAIDRALTMRFKPPPFDVASEPIPHAYITHVDMATGIRTKTFAPLPNVIALYHIRGYGLKK